MRVRQEFQLDRSDSEDMAEAILDELREHGAHGAADRLGTYWTENKGMGAPLWDSISHLCARAFALGMAAGRQPVLESPE